MTTLHPTVLWAQRKDKLFVTIDLQNCKDPQIDITNDEGAKAGKLTFRGVAQSHATGPEEHSYVLDLEFFDEIDPEDVQQVKTERKITLVIPKKDDGAPHWPRLLKPKGKAPQYVKADWDKWVDEDDEEDGADEGGMPAGFDPSMMQQFQGMGGGGGMGGMEGLAGMMGGMGGGGGAGGMGGMAEMMSKMGGMGGMGGGGGGGMEGFDMSSLGDLAAGAGGAEDDEGDSEDDMPPLDAPGSSS